MSYEKLIETEFLPMVKRHNEEVSRLKTKNALDNILGFGGWLMAAAIVWCVYYDKPLIERDINVQVYDCENQKGGAVPSGVMYE